MSVTLWKSILLHSRARGEARCVLQALAFHASQEKVTRYGDTTAHPSRETLAREAGIPDSPKGPNVTQVTRKLRELEDLGEIQWTGETKGRGAKVYEILLPIEAEPVTPKESRLDDEAVTPRESRVERSRDTKESRVAAADAGGRDISARTRDTRDGSRDTEESRPPVTSECHANKKGTSDLEQELEPARAPNGARGRSSPHDWLPSPDWARERLGIDRKRPGETAKERNQREAEEREEAAEVAERRERMVR